MKQEAADEFVGIELHEFELILFFSIAVTEGARVF